MPHTLEAKGFTAWVEVNGKKLECYGTSKDTREDTRSQEASCWIASQENETFSVNLSKTTRNFSCVAYLSFDGQEISNKVIKGCDTSAMWYRKVVEGYRRPFTFSSQIVDDDDALLDGRPPSHSRIGEIQIRIKRITGLKTIRVPVRKDKADAEAQILTPIQKIHETHVKATKPPHQIALGEATSKKSRGKVRDSHKYSTKETLATLIFRYRPLDTLVDNGIAPAPEQAVAAALHPQSLNGRASHEKPQLTPLKMKTRQHSSPPPVASSSRLRPAIKAKTGPAVCFDHAYITGHPSASSSSAMARTPATDTTLATESESKTRITHIKGDPDELEILEDEEQLLLARLESVRNRKRKALDEPKAVTSRKVLKRESSIPRGRFAPGEVIDLT